MAEKVKIPGATFVEGFREPHARADYYAPDHGTETLYVDGMATMSLSASVAKVDLFVIEKVTEEDDYTVEHRVVKYRVTMPIGAFAELCAKALGGISQAKDQMIDAFDQMRDNLSKYSVTGAPEAEIRTTKK